MIRCARLRRACIALGAFAILGAAAWGQAQPVGAMSCFTVAGNMSCIDVGVAPPAPFMPPVIVPIGAQGDGEDHKIVIEDDGGRRVARG